MNRLAVFATCCLSVAAASSQATSLCDVAQEGLQRLAQVSGSTADARCREPARLLPAGAVMQPMEWPLGQVLRSGPVTWPVRVRLGNGYSYVQQVPLTVAWTTLAWVAARNLDPGVELQAGDLEMKPRRWPEGRAVQPAGGRSEPLGRVRSALRAGDIVTADVLLPSGALIRGDHVTAVLAQGGMEIRVPAQLLATSRIGDVARVQAAGRTSPLEGRLVDAQTLMVVSE